MTRKCHIHILQTWQRRTLEEVTQNTDSRNTIKVKLPVLYFSARWLLHQKGHLDWFSPLYLFCAIWYQFKGYQELRHKTRSKPQKTQQQTLNKQNQNRRLRTDSSDGFQLLMVCHTTYTAHAKSTMMKRAWNCYMHTVIVHIYGRKAAR